MKKITKGDSKTFSVVQIISSGGFYGAESVVVELATFLHQHGYKSRIIVLESPGADDIVREAEKRGVTVDRLQGNFWQLILKLRQYVKEQAVDVIHSHGYKTDVLVIIACLFYRLGKVATCHTWYSDSFKLKFYEWLDKRSLFYFDRVVLVSPQLVDDVKQCGIDSGKISLIENGVTLLPPSVEFPKSVLLEELGLGEDVSLVIRIGRLAKSKGNDALLTAFAQLGGSNSHILFIGEGEEKQSLEQQARSLGVFDRVSLMGYRTDVTELLHASDVFVISSYKEGLPIVLLEAMAAAKAIVSTNVGGIAELIKDQHNGWLVPPGDVEALTLALSEALNDKGKAQLFGTRAEKKHMQNYSGNAMGRRYLKVYESIMG